MQIDKNTIEIDGPAKINLALSVGSVNEAGMHPIGSWMIAVNLCDRLRLTINENDDGSKARICFADDAIRPCPIDWPLEKDLAYRAHRAIERYIGRRLPIAWQLTKKIPTGAGLAGGSSDAAAMLIAVNALFDLGLTMGELTEIALGLGSDIPFLLHAILGSSSAIVSNLGRDITEAPYRNTLRLILIFPEIHCKTPDVFQRFDRLHEEEIYPAMERVKQLAGEAFIAQDGAFNHLADATYEVYPALGALQASLEKHLQIKVHLSGSGSTLFVIGAGDTSSKLIEQKIKNFTKLPTLRTTMRRYNPKP